MILRDWLEAEPFALAMSSGFFGFFAHAGFLTALERAGLRPARLAGSSAGALIAGLWAAGCSCEVIERTLRSLDRQAFWDPALGFGLLRGERFAALLEELLPVQSFEECRVPLAVSAFHVAGRRTVVFDSGPLSPAIRASCAFPLLLQPVPVDGRRYLDGGIADRAGLLGLEGSERIFTHHLVSRSPWRRAGSAALRVPRRSGLVALAIDGLPRVSPFRLVRGQQAFEQALEATQIALGQPVVDGAVRLDLSRDSPASPSAHLDD